ncbi:TonB family protein [Novosphingobium tardum]|uniref:TonB family protein n=1 Tax=Novosphingobium tardum TaxID=1538021 RepID=A0ABV8RMJ1_9SPHN
MYRSLAQKSPLARLGPAFAAILINLGLAWLLVFGLSANGVVTRTQALVSVALSRPPVPPPPAPIPPPQPRVSSEASGKASPPNIRSKAAQVFAPPVARFTPPPLPTAPKPGTGSQTTQGAAPVTGPGTGAGGYGNGTGSGGEGDGTGGGGSDPDWVGGRIKDRDYPLAARQAQAGGTTQTTLAIGTDGRVRSCRVTRSSGNAQLDETTCQLVLQRFRFRPARDAAGRTVPSTVDYDQVWTLHPGD